MLVWCDLHVARNILCTAISRAVVTNTRDFTKILGTSHKIHACTALASVKFKSSCYSTVTYIYICTHIDIYVRMHYVTQYEKTAGSYG